MLAKLQFNFISLSLFYIEFFEHLLIMKTISTARFN